MAKRKKVRSGNNRKPSKSAQRAGNSRTVAARRTAKVWHIFRFQERFELPDDARYCRKSPLLYTRDYVGSGNDDESISYHQQICILRSRPNRLELRGVFAELREIAANRSRAYRGYLLDEKLQPASDKKVSQWLDLDIAKTKKILHDLTEIGLLERVELPDFDPSDNESPAENEDPDKAKRQREGGRNRCGRKGKTARSRSIPGSSVRTRNDPRSLTRVTKKEEHEVQSSSRIGKSGNKRSKKKSGKAASAAPMHTPTRESQSHPKLKIHHIGNVTEIIDTEAQLVAADNGKAPVSPTTAPPTSTDPTIPTNPDAKQGAQNCLNASSGPAASVSSPEMLYDAKAFAAAVYEELRLSVYPKPAADELACFATAWRDALDTRLSSSALRDLWNKSIREARKLGRKPHSAFTKGRGAVWRKIFNERLSNAPKAQAATG